jgi:hypothetical protein
MNDSSNQQKKPKGRPFTKGDERIFRAGGSKLLLTYPKNFKQALAEGISPQEFAALLIESAKRGRPGAREMIAKYLIGEPPQKYELSHDIQLSFEYASGDDGGEEEGQDE